MYKHEIENLTDFLNNQISIKEAYTSKKVDEEVKLMYVLRKTFKIPDEATIWLSYDLEEEVLTLSSNQELRISSKEGFILVRDESFKSLRYDINGTVLNYDYIYRYIFRM